METNLLSKSTIGFGLSFAIVSIFNGLLVILKETNPSVMAWMTALTGNHWITQGVFNIILFLLLGFIFTKINLQKKFSASMMSNITIFATVVGVILIAGFKLVELNH
jgi:hypothetical protein